MKTRYLTLNCHFIILIKIHNWKFIINHLLNHFTTCEKKFKKIYFRLKFLNFISRIYVLFKLKK